MNIAPNKTEFSDAEHVELIARVRTAMKSEGMSQADVSRGAEVAAPTLSQYLNGTYPTETGKAATAQKLSRWLKTVEQVRSQRSTLPTMPTYLPLAGSKAIRTQLGYAFVAGRQILLTGAPGTGKSATARQFAEDTPRTWYAAMNPTTSGVPTMLLAILKAMGVSDAKGTPQQLLQRIIDVAVVAKGLIIVDEANHLTANAIETVRSINDLTRDLGNPVGVAIMGNSVAYQNVGPTGAKAEFAQVSSRFAKRRYIKDVNLDDAAALANAWAETNGEVITKVELDYCRYIASTPGGLRNIEMAMEGALLAARGEGEPLALHHIKSAFDELSGQN